MLLGHVKLAVPLYSEQHSPLAEDFVDRVDGLRKPGFPYVSLLICEQGSDMFPFLFDFREHDPGLLVPETRPEQVPGG